MPIHEMTNQEHSQVQIFFGLSAFRTDAEIIHCEMELKNTALTVRSAGPVLHDDLPRHGITVLL